MQVLSSTVFLVADDPKERISLRQLFSTQGLGVQTYGTGGEFLASPEVDAPGCLVVDFGLPDMNGLEFQNRLRERGSGVPLILLATNGDVATCVQAMKSGALDYFAKPVSENALLSSIRHALERDAERQAIAERLKSLTGREREVMEWLVDGLAMKEIATNCQTSFQTVAKHRQRVLEKLGVENDVALVKLVLSVRSGETNGKRS